jgi:hypothetical protein
MDIICNGELRYIVQVSDTTMLKQPSALATKNCK